MNITSDKVVTVDDLASALSELHARVERLESVVQVTVPLSELPIK